MHVYACMGDKGGRGRFLSPTLKTRCEVSLSPDGQISHTSSLLTVIRSYGILPRQFLLWGKRLRTISYNELLWLDGKWCMGPSALTGSELRLP